MRKKSIFISFIILMILAFTGCGKNNKEQVSPDETNQSIDKEDVNLVKKYENKMVLGMDTPITLNPLYNTKSTVEQILYLIFSPLINIEEDGSVSGNIAKSWIVNDTNTAVTVTLRNDIKWHDGQSLTTDDVIYTMQKIKDITDSPYKDVMKNVQEVSKVDSFTFKVTYKTSFSGVMQTLFFPIIPKHIYEVGEGQNIKPVGSGPYKYKESPSTKSMNLISNSEYFKGEPNIKDIEVKFISDEEGILYAFKQGLIDIAYTSDTEWGKYTNEDASTSYEMISPLYEFMGINHDKVMFQNSFIREALIYGINRDELVHLFNLDHAIVTDTPISPALYIYDRTLETKKYDKEKVKLLLTTAGYKKDDNTGIFNKDGIPLSFTLMVNERDSVRTKVARQIQIMYQQVGIDMKIEIVDSQTYMDRIKANQFDAFLVGYQIGYATDLSFALHSKSIAESGNYTNYNDKQMDELLQKVFIAPNDKVYEAYQKLQQYFIKQTPFISLYFKKSVLVTKNSIEGDIKSTPTNVFYNVESWRISGN